ncbi:NAD(P)H-hydrate dehydratase [Pararhodobacter oceanensis]|uniref:Bifunctional NAD(P)H-hydrate repair enzyme n=1 Tax=Pararhodobacter oceanensis TaxID=2172121 RepID=A0A2T8HYB1_9RHOB|nr:NAD(P)H-hydrate dehydratase [Pararhodobacter oceanensis]PVH30404.1 bifunctional ADP-dependent NAD(P)H-hydrate dehydratase/NAD(P)H-hydrate epimerase [Pararhodobacter oceanensis]
MTGQIPDIVTTAQMRALEQRAIAAGEVSGLTLMERAGEGVVKAIIAHAPEANRAVVLCGKGNNGGDGFVIARLLAARGWQVRVCALTAETLSAGQIPVGDAGENARRWLAAGQGVYPLTAEAIRDGLSEGAVLIDALLGIGQSRSPEALLAPVHTASAEFTRLTRVAVDLPTGLCSDSGRWLCDAPFRADLTVTFHAPKPCHMLAEGPEICGALEIAPLGLRPEPGIPLITGPLCNLGKSGGHKFSHGHALVLSGGSGRGGAARLAARAALRIGAGLVTLGCPRAAIPENAARLDAVMLTPVDTADDLATSLSDPRISALLLGPGLGLDARAHALVDVALRDTRPCVLDADALTLIAGDAALRAHLHAGCILTPHGGEFARLFPDLSARMRGSGGPSRIDAATEAAQELGVTLLMKGPDTVIAGPNGRCALHAALRERAVPWLATAGAGDVLAGLIAGLLARGMPGFEAAASAAYLHASAAQVFGPGLIAEDLHEAIPQVLRGLIAH